MHGRFWDSSGPSFKYTVTTSTATLIDTSDASNKPPELVLENSWAGDDLVLVDPTLPSGGVPVYLAMYFSDPIDTLSSRSFNIFFGGNQVNESPVVPELGKTIQVVVRGVVASSTSLLEFHSTSGSRFPPMINALELYLISGWSGSSGSRGLRFEHTCFVISLSLGRKKNPKVIHLLVSLIIWLRTYFDK